MKNFFFILLFIPFCMSSQLVDRVYIQGKVNVPLKDDASNINVVNKNTKAGTITDEIGAFNIFVAVGDELSFSAVQYQDFEIVINEVIFDQKKMTITLNEANNTLEEVVIKPYDLTGNIEVDAQKVNTQDNINLDKDAKKAIRTMEDEYTQDRQTTEKKAITSDQFIEYGLDVANIFRKIFKNVGKNEDKLPNNLDVTVRKMYDDDFFNEYLNIEQNRINEFIFFIQDQAFDNELLKKENQLDFIQFLVCKSDEFKSR